MRRVLSVSHRRATAAAAAHTTTTTTTSSARAATSMRFLSTSSNATTTPTSTPTTSTSSSWSGPGDARTPAKVLAAKVDQFRRDVDKYLPSNGHKVAFGTAWIATDNVVVHLLHQHFPEVLAGMNLVAVDTLHLFDETHEVADAVQRKYGKQAIVYKPLGLNSKKEFEARFGPVEEMSHAEFDYHSKVEPFARALKELQRDVLITGRRMDQGDVRVNLDTWEAETRNFSPMAAWTWADVLSFVDAHGVPVNRAHNYVFRASQPIEATQRHLPNLPWTKVDMGKPYWQLSKAELWGSSSSSSSSSSSIPTSSTTANPTSTVYVFQSFGDVHTSVPVLPHQSERAGRFVRYANTECGIHTRVATQGAAHGGGKLVDLLVTDANKRQQIIASTQGRVIELNERQACDVELLVSGAFSPLEGFMTKDSYDSVVSTMRLPEQQLFGMPVVLDIPTSSGIKEGQSVLLRFQGKDVAVLDVQSRWTPNKRADAVKLFTTSSEEHPYVEELLNHTGDDYLGGRIHGLALSFRARDERFRTPKEVREMLSEWRKAHNNAPASTPVIAFQCRNVIHRAHYELLRRAAEKIPGSVVLVHPTVGPTQPDDLEPMARIPAYEALEGEIARATQNNANNNNNNDFLWSFLPYSMKMAGPREAIQHMIMRKNYGATHFIVGRDMAGTKSTKTGKDFHGPYDAQNIAKTHAQELGMEVLTFENMVYTASGVYMPESEAKANGLSVQKLSGTEFRRLLRSGEQIPQWFSFESVVAALRVQGVSDGVRL